MIVLVVVSVNVIVGDSVAVAEFVRDRRVAEFEPVCVSDVDTVSVAVGDGESDDESVVVLDMETLLLREAEPDSELDQEVDRVIDAVAEWLNETDLLAVFVPVGEARERDTELVGEADAVILSLWD